MNRERFGSAMVTAMIAGVSMALHWCMPQPGSVVRHTVTCRWTNGQQAEINYEACPTGSVLVREDEERVGVVTSAPEATASAPRRVHAQRIRDEFDGHTFVRLVFSDRPQPWMALVLGAGSEVAVQWRRDRRPWAYTGCDTVQLLVDHTPVDLPRGEAVFQQEEGGAYYEAMNMRVPFDVVRRMASARSVAIRVCFRDRLDLTESELIALQEFVALAPTPSADAGVPTDGGSVP